MFRKIKEIINDIEAIKSFLLASDKKMDHIINQQRVTANFYDDVDDGFDFSKTYIGKRVGIKLNDKWTNFGECINAGIIITNAKNFKYDIKNFLVIKDRNGDESTEIISKDKEVEILSDEVSTPTVSHGEVTCPKSTLTWARAYNHIIEGSDTP